MTKWSVSLRKVTYPTLESYFNRTDTMRAPVTSGKRVIPEASATPRKPSYPRNWNSHPSSSTSPMRRQPMRYRPPVEVAPVRTKQQEGVGIYQLPAPSEEQGRICSSVRRGYNVMVDSVFGCGKTTTILHVCQKNPKASILLLTYNSRLKLETRSKVQALGLTNVEVHSYHAFGVKYYSSDCLTDLEIKRVLANQTPPKRPFHFDMIVLDEQQDMTPLYYKFTQKIIADRTTSAPPQIVLFGDNLPEYLFLYGSRR